MKNRLLAGIILIFAIALCLTGCKADPDPEPVIVYVNASVNMDYHKADCVAVTTWPEKIFHPVTREEAIGLGYRQCQICKP